MAKATQEISQINKKENAIIERTVKSSKLWGMLGSQAKSYEIF